MTHEPEHSANGPEVLSPREAAELERIDALLAWAGARERAATPANLVDRVFAASAALLPAPAALQGPWGIETKPRPRTLRLATWSRIALAACVALAFVIARPALQPRSATLTPEMALALSNTTPDSLLGIVMSSSRSDTAYMESFGIFDTGAGDLLGEVSLMLESAPPAPGVEG